MSEKKKKLSRREFLSVGGTLGAAAVVGQCVSAFEIARLFLEKFGGDSLSQVKRSYKSYLKELSRRCPQCNHSEPDTSVHPKIKRMSV